MKILSLKYKKYEVRVSFPDDFEEDRMLDIAEKNLYSDVGKGIVGKKYVKTTISGVRACAEIKPTLPI